MYYELKKLNITYSQHHLFNTRMSKILRWMSFRFGIQNILHDENDVLDELGIGVIDNDLTLAIKEFLNNDLDLVKEDRIQCW